MDEFDVYLARAYGGGQPANEVSSNRMALNPGSRPGRRHSSVGMRCSADILGSGHASSPPSSSTKVASKVGRRKQDSVGSDVTSARRKLSATVMVAVEPPSPTEFRHPHLPPGGARAAYDRHALDNGNSASDNEDPSDNDVTDPMQFSRSRDTSKPQKVSSSSGAADDNVMFNGRRRESGDRNVSSVSSMTANSSRSNRNRKDNQITYAAMTAASRPERLSLGTQQRDADLPVVTVGCASPGQSRRRSTACTPDNHRLAVADQPSPGAQRRNSCVGLVTSSPQGLQRASYGCLSTLNATNSPSSGGVSLLSASSSGRRNSAIIYLTESTGMPAASGRCSPYNTVSDARRSFSADGAIVNQAQLQSLQKLAALSQGNDSGTMSPDAVPQTHRGSPGVVSLQSVAEKHICRVAVLGAHEVGKSTLTSQLLTSEYLANRENYQGER